VDPDAYLPGTGLGFGQVDDLENVWAAEFGESDRLHRRTTFLVWSPAGRVRMRPEIWTEFIG
jgi:hypothetical protein